MVGFQRALGSSDPHRSAMQELWHRSPCLELFVSPKFSQAWALSSEKERSCAVQTTQVPSAGNDSLGCSEAGANDVTWVCALRWGRLGCCREDGEVLAPSRRLAGCEEAPVPLLRLRRPAGLVPRASREHHEIPATVLGTHTIYFFIEGKLQNESLPFCGGSLESRAGPSAQTPCFPGQGGCFLKVGKAAASHVACTL